MIISGGFDAAFKHRAETWKNLCQRAHWIQEMGAFLIGAPEVTMADKKDLNMQMHALTNLCREDACNGQWTGVCLDMGMMQITDRLKRVNETAARYPIAVERYRAIQRQAEAGKPVQKTPRTKFCLTWQRRYHVPLLNAYLKELKKDACHGF